MIRLISWLVFVVVSAVFIWFCVLNRHPIALDLWAVTTPPIPVWVLLVIGLLIGFTLGGIVAWLAGGRRRERTRDLSRLHEADQRQIAILKDKVERFQAAERQVAIPAAPAQAS